MFQVAHLIEEAVQAHVVLMSQNRRDVHRDAKPGPEFGSLVYPTTQQALAFTPPVDALPRTASGYAAPQPNAAGMICRYLCCCIALRKPVIRDAMKRLDDLPKWPAACESVSRPVSYSYKVSHKSV